MSKNIVEVYKEFNGQLIILISGLSGCGKSVIGKNINNDFDIDMIDVNKYYKVDFNEKIKLPNNIEIINYDTDNAIDWDKLNTDVNNKKQKGVVVVGPVFPTDKLAFVPDYHIHLKISKQRLRDKRTEYLEKHGTDSYNKSNELLKINSVTYPYYLDTLHRMKINKFVDVTELTSDRTYDLVFDEIIKYIDDKVYAGKRISHDKPQYETTETKEKPNKITPFNRDYIISYSINYDQL